MKSLRVDMAEFENWLSWRNKIGRATWKVAYTLFFRFLTPSIFNCWRLFLLRLFGAKIHPRAHVYATARIWAPWNLVVDEYAAIGPNVNVYNTGMISIGAHTTISQGAYLCPGSHDISNPKFPMICAPLTIEDQVWVATEAFVGGMGTTIKQGAVIGARACVFRDVEKWQVVGGNPAKFIKKRELS